MPDSKFTGEPFFLAMSLALLAVVLAGFSSSFYFRDEALPSLSSDLVAHGVVLTIWFVTIVVQTVLVGVGRSPQRMQLHRRLGMASAAVVFATLWTGYVVTVEFYRKGPGDIVVGAPALLFANLFNLVGMAICFVAGVRHRRNPPAHKRYMTWASVVIIAPATFRLVQGLGFPPWSAALAQLVFVVVLFAYDKRATGRIHGPTWTGTAIVLFQMVGSFTIGSSDAWAELAGSLFGSSG